MFDFGPTDPECLDQGEQIEHVHVPEGVGPPQLSARGFEVDEKVAIEMRNSSDIPGVASQGARADTARIVTKMGNDHFDDLRGEPGDQGRGCCRGLGRSILGKNLLDFGKASIPGYLGEELDHYSGDHD